MIAGERAVNQDFIDLLAAFDRNGARYLIVGAHALALHGVPRATGDLDVWVDGGAENLDRAWKALIEFGAPLAAIGVVRGDLDAPDRVIQIGLPPRRIDILTGVSGLDFATAWPQRVEHPIRSLRVPFLGRDDLVRNKRAAGRAKDLADLEALGE